MDKFINLIDYLKREKRDDFYLELAQIEEIAGVELSKSAYEYSAYWSTSGTHYLANQIWDCGFKISPDLKNKRIRLMRITETANKAEAKRDKATKIRTAKRKENIPQPSKELVEHYLKKWDMLEDYSAQEDAVNKVFKDNVKFYFEKERLYLDGLNNQIKLKEARLNLVEYIFKVWYNDLIISKE